MMLLKRTRSAKLVLSSPSSPYDDFEGFSEHLGNSPKQGRKTDTGTQGRILNFEEDPNFGVDDLDKEETQGTYMNLSQQNIEHVDLEAEPEKGQDSTSCTAQYFATAEVNFPTAAIVEEESSRPRIDKGKAPIIEESEQPRRKISASD